MESTVLDARLGVVYTLKATGEKFKVTSNGVVVELRDENGAYMSVTLQQFREKFKE